MDPNYWFNIARIFTLIGGLMTVAGGFGLWHFGQLKDLNTSEKIRNSEETAAKANAEAANANAEAAKAVTKSKEIEIELTEAKKETELAKQETEKVRLKVEETHKQSQQIEIKLEEQKERAAQAEKELILLQEKVKPRSVSTKDVQLLVSELSTFTEKNINIGSSMGEGEATAYATQIKNIFEAAGWKVDSGIGFSTFTGVGIIILTNKNDNKDVKAIKAIFSKVGIMIHEQYRAEGPNIQIFVGSKNTEG